MKVVQVLIDHDPRWGLSTKRVRDMMIEIMEKDARVLTHSVVSLLFTGAKKAQTLNISYRNMDYVPQVLGFPTEEMQEDVDGKVHLGDIVVCIPRLREDSRLWNRQQYDVLYEWLVHGLDNLFKPSLGTVDTLPRD